MDEIKDSAKANNTTVGKRTVRAVIEGNLVKNYTLVGAMSKETGISRKKIALFLLTLD